MNCEVAVIGAGPMGLAAAAELNRRGLATVVFEKGCLANSIDWFPLGMRFYSSAKNLELLGFPIPTSGEKPTREDYLAYLRGFVRYHRIDVRTYENVEQITGSFGDFRLHTRQLAGSTAEHAARTVVLAIGSTEFPRQLGVPGEDLPHVFHLYKDLHRYFGQRVVVVGGRNSACDAAIALAHIGAKVTIVHRKPHIEPRQLKYWVHPEITGMLRRNVIAGKFSRLVASIDPAGVVLRSTDDPDSTERVECDFVLILIGFDPDYRLLEQLNLKLTGESREPKVNEETFETSAPGVYACGTIVAGNQDPYRVFIENAHHHPIRIADAIEKSLST